jgi:hypothetical protein
MSTAKRVGWWRWWTVGYVGLVGVILVAMLRMRHSTVAQMSEPTSIADWQAWRADVSEQQSRRGPVERRVPKSEQPPALVLMRDYFTVLMIGALLFSSMLYWIIAWFVTGLVASK